ncbi:hypothetical protein Sjap_024607 [Stephania japonica]|uniref:Uncharacterized protein n=1 Tax=Stephania japonica TaxID=461633 RepID=A0AAP0EFW3_9MAGN
MADADANEGSKRRLPSWMSGVNSSNRSSKSDSNSSKIVSVGENLDSDRLETSPPKGDRKRKPRNGGDAVKKKKKKRNGVDDEIERVGEKPVRGKKGRKSKSCELGNGEGERAESVSGYEEEELTVEDLMSIAEEYVKKADNDEDNSKYHRTDARGSSRPVFNEHESEVSTEAAHAIEVSKRRTASSSTSLSNFTCSIDLTRDGAAKGNEEAQSIMDAGFSQRITGDPTQDMLNLFLGPLLMQPPVEERRLEDVEKDITLHSELRKKEALQEKVVPLVAKKRSSLKDKVTLFLD